MRHHNSALVVVGLLGLTAAVPLVLEAEPSTLLDGDDAEPARAAVSRLPDLLIGRAFVLGRALPLC